MKNKKILITGGAGFIGSHLTESLANENEVIVLDSLLRGNKIPQNVLEKIKFVKGDVCDKDVLIELSKGCDYIFHLAALLGVDIVADNPVETMNTEVVGMRNVSVAAITYGSKIIYASTSGIYGHNSIKQSVKEDMIVDPKTSYSIAKRYNEIYLAALHQEKGLNCIALRYFNVYGLRQDERMVTPRFIKQALANEDITVFGSGFQTRDFTYIADTIKSTILAADRVEGFQIFNVANEREETILNLAKKIKKMTNSDSELKLVNFQKKRYDYEVERRVGCSDKLFTFIDYKPNTNLKEGLTIILDEMCS